ncbi:MAG: protein translocase subunit SecF [Candidatus Aminicenantia bacterium]
MQIFKAPKINFMKFKYFALLLSGIIILSGIMSIVSKKGLNLGVDFAGGTLIRIKFVQPMPIEEIRQALKKAGLGESKIQKVGKEGIEYLIRTVSPEEKVEEKIEAHEIMGRKVIEALRSEEKKFFQEKGLKDLNSIGSKELALLLENIVPVQQAEEIADKIIKYKVNPKHKGVIEKYSDLKEIGIKDEVINYLKEKTFLGEFVILSKETVGPTVGHDLRRKATQATIWALIGMLIYIGIRFQIGYGVAAIFTLAHDILVTIAFLSFANREINLPVIAAILTIVGYSLNDTIVIFDRVRDNLKVTRKKPFEEILNDSINQTLSRTIITSLTTLLTVLVLYSLGGEVINDFAFTMLIGIISGTYSTIYQSCPIVLAWHRIFKEKKKFGK